MQVCSIWVPIGRKILLFFMTDMDKVLLSQCTKLSLECFAEEFRSSQVLTAVLAALGKSDLLRTHETSKVKGVLDTLSLF